MAFTPHPAPGPTPNTPLEPELAAFISRIRHGVYRAAGSSPDVKTLREASRAARLEWSLAGPKVPLIETPDFGMATRLYRPANAGTGPLLIYLHGGGWTILDLDTHDRLMRAYALASGWNVIGLAYPLAPEVCFPRSLMASATTVERIVGFVGGEGVGPERIVLGGDSSGANLALSIEIARLGAGMTPLAGLLLNYGVYDSDLSRPSYERFSDAPYLLTRRRMDFFWETYCPDPQERLDERAAPLRTELAALAKLPPVHLTIAAQDVLVDENMAFWKKLMAAGVDVTCEIYDDAAHAFLEAVHCSPVADRAVANGAAWVQRL